MVTRSRICEGLHLAGVMPEFRHSVVEGRGWFNSCFSSIKTLHVRTETVEGIWVSALRAAAGVRNPCQPVVTFTQGIPASVVFFSPSGVKFCLQHIQKLSGDVTNHIKVSSI